MARNSRRELSDASDGEGAERFGTSTGRLSGRPRAHKDVVQSVDRRKNSRVHDTLKDQSRAVTSARFYSRARLSLAAQIVRLMY
jgi:hypothetical protein